VSNEPANPKAPPRIGARRHARECALQLLYQLDGRSPPGGDPGLSDTLAVFWAHLDPEAVENRQTTEYAEELVRGTLEHGPEIDAAIEAVAQHWRMDRMARVDRNILRLATYELLHSRVDARIVINEAVELAKGFGTEESGSFVNGVLDRVAETSVP
jgi:N utilization substance protein B